MFCCSVFLLLPARHPLFPPPPSPNINSQRTRTMVMLVTAEDVDFLERACAQDETPAVVEAICSCKFSADVCRVGSVVIVTLTCHDGSKRGQKRCF